MARKEFTAGRLEIEVNLAEAGPTPVYQQIAVRVGRLRELAMSYKAIADDKTVAKAVAWLDSPQ